jgi:RNA 3'-terminal phosphate cyclase (ATP)
VIRIDGSQGEGGGQILRSALSLAICTGQAFRIEHIRARREKPGLLRQHVTAARAAAEISDAEVDGCEVGSSALTFKPRGLRAGEYSFAIGTAGSCTLVLQTVLPPLLTASAPSVVRISGGTHNKAAPPVDFLTRAFLPLVARMGAVVELRLVRHGFYPRGGGIIEAHIEPAERLRPIELVERGARLRAYAESYICGVPIHVAQRELAVVGGRLGWTDEQLKVRGIPSEAGPGNVLVLTVEHEHVTEVFTGFGERGRSAESVAEDAVREAHDYLAHAAPVGPHLADQLLLPMALGGVSVFRTCAPTPHFLSNAEVIHAFTGRRIVAERADDMYDVQISGENRCA